MESVWGLHQWQGGGEPPPLARTPPGPCSTPGARLLGSVHLHAPWKLMDVLDLGEQEHRCPALDAAGCLQGRRSHPASEVPGR